MDDIRKIKKSTLFIFYMRFPIPYPEKKMPTSTCIETRHVHIRRAFLAGNPSFRTCGVLPSLVLIQSYDRSSVTSDPGVLGALSKFEKTCHLTSSKLYHALGSKTAQRKQTSGSTKTTQEVPADTQRQAALRTCLRVLFRCFSVINGEIRSRDVEDYIASIVGLRRLSNMKQPKAITRGCK